MFEEEIFSLKKLLDHERGTSSALKLQLINIIN